MLVVYPHLEYYENVFMQWIDHNITHLEKYNENVSGSVVLFIENLSVNISKFKKKLF
jgi:hypothetical protein